MCLNSTFNIEGVYSNPSISQTELFWRKQIFNKVSFRFIVIDSDVGAAKIGYYKKWLIEGIEEKPSICTNIYTAIWSHHKLFDLLTKI